MADWGISLFYRRGPDKPGHDAGEKIARSSTSLMPMPPGLAMTHIGTLQNSTFLREPPKGTPP